jgi:hypothetical protein
MALDIHASPADGGALTVEQSIASQLENFEREDTETVETPEAAPAAEQDTGAQPGAEGDAEVETPDGGEGADKVEAETPIEPPQFWSAEAKSRFRDVPRDVQEVILAQENSRNAFTSKAAQDATETRKAAEAERARLVSFNEQLSALVPQAQRAFADRWANVDWVQLTDQIGAEQATKLKFQHDADQAQLASLQQAQAETDKAAYQDFLKTESQKLPTLCPELVDAKEGPQRRQALQKYLVEQNGVTPQTLSRASAQELTIAWKAFQWDQSQAKAKALATKPKPAAVAQPTKAAPSRPGSTVGVLQPANAALAEAEKAFNANPSVDNSAKLQMAQMRARKK